MANQEKDPFQHEQFDQGALEQAGAEQREALKEKAERGQEHEQVKDLESARSEALEQAARSEKEQHPEVTSRTPEKPRLITKKDKEQSFNTTMKEVRSQMSATSRGFSKVIHQPAVEKTSEVIGNTIARPNAILTGSLFAFLFTASFYLIARFNGYPLSGSETIASFIAGWCVGLIIDYIRLLVIGKK
ncbi:MAG: hypothetical protein ABIP74_01065 [Candidatus Saccharimonas sp.]